MAGNAYSTYTGNVMMTPPGQQALLAQPTVAASNTGVAGNPSKKARTSIQAATTNLGGPSGFRSPYSANKNIDVQALPTDTFS